MKPAYRTRTNAIYAALGIIAREGKPEPGQRAFDARFSIHQNRRGFVIIDKASRR